LNNGETGIGRNGTRRCGGRAIVPFGLQPISDSSNTANKTVFAGAALEGYRVTRIIFALTSFLLFFLGFQSEGVATPVPHQLYGKSVTISSTGTDVWWNETTGKNVTIKRGVTVIFYFSSQGRIFARRSYHDQSGSRTYEQVGSDPTLRSRPVLATGQGQMTGDTGMSSFQDLHFDGRALIGTSKVGENGAGRMTIEFDQNFGSCTWTSVRGSDNGKPIRKFGAHREILRAISLQVTDRRCTIQDGNAFQQ
jgi:hypothetical protein